MDADDFRSVRAAVRELIRGSVAAPRGADRGRRRDPRRAARPGRRDGAVRLRAARGARGARRHHERGRATRVRVRVHDAGLPLALRHQQRHRGPGDREVRHRGTAAEVPAPDGRRRADRLVRAHRGRGRLRSRRAAHVGAAGRRRLGDQRGQALHHQCAPGRPVRRLRAQRPGADRGPGHLQLRRGGHDAGRERRPARQEDGPVRCLDRRGVLRRRARRPRRADRRGGPRLREGADRALPGPAAHRCPVRRDGPAGARRVGRLRRLRQAGWRTDRPLPAGPGDARRHARRAPRRPQHGARRRRAVRHGRGHLGRAVVGQAVLHRDGRPRGGPGRAGARRPGLPAHDGGRALLPGRPAVPALRGHQRGPAADHRWRPAARRRHEKDPPAPHPSHARGGALQEGR